MAKLINMTKSTKGFYTVEAAIFLPIVILAVLSMGYFMKIEGTWENCIHGAVDESALAASRSYDNINAASIGSAVSKRINEDNPYLTSMKIKNIRIMYDDGNIDDVTSYRITAAIDLKLPMGFSRRFRLDQGIKFRGFTGVDHISTPLGAEGLETLEKQEPVWIFPHSGERFHAEECTYIKAAASPAVLTSALHKKHDPCRICSSEDVAIGSIVFCFEGEGTAYHRSTCGTMIKHTSVIDKSEAVKKGYLPCTKCGG